MCVFVNLSHACCQSSKLKVKNFELCFCEDGLLRLADPSFVDACQQHITSRYYNCDIKIANDAEIVNNRAWLACPTYAGTSLCRCRWQLSTVTRIRQCKPIVRVEWREYIPIRIESIRIISDGESCLAEMFTHSTFLGDLCHCFWPDLKQRHLHHWPTLIHPKLKWSPKLDPNWPNFQLLL